MGSAPPSILVVDDDPQVLKLFVRMLEQGGYHVYGVLSGKEAMSYLQERSIDLLVLDLGMPEPDGFEILESLRAMRSDLMILAISGLMVRSSLLKAAKVLGATATLSKTEAPTRLLLTVNKLLEKKRLASTMEAQN